MGDKTAIEWCDTTWNPVTGCTRVSPGCDHCYASTLHNGRYRSNMKAALASGIIRRDGEHGPLAPMVARKHGARLPFPQQYDTPFAQVKTWEHKLTEPLHWKKPRRIFTCSMGDLFHEWVPFEVIDRVFAVMALTPQHTYQVLTKRPERMREYVCRVAANNNLVWDCANRLADGMARAAIRRLEPVFWPLPNVWLGTSVENQEKADARIPVLLDTPAAVRFISAEPLLGRVDLCEHLGIWWNQTTGAWVRESHGPTLDWIIAGGESGPKARPCDVEWIRSIVRQCQAAGVPVFVKQLGSVVHGPDKVTSLRRWILADEDGNTGEWTPPIIGDYAHVRPLNAIGWRPAHSHGGNPTEWPEDLRVREFPNA